MPCGTQGVHLGTEGQPETSGGVLPRFPREAVVGLFEQSPGWQGPGRHGPGTGGPHLAPRGGGSWAGAPLRVRVGPVCRPFKAPLGSPDAQAAHTVGLAGYLHPEVSFFLSQFPLEFQSPVFRGPAATSLWWGRTSST